MIKIIKSNLYKKCKQLPKQLLAILLCMVMLESLVVPAVAAAVEKTNGQTVSSGYLEELVDEMAVYTGSKTAAVSLLNQLRNKGVVDATGMPILNTTFDIDGQIMTADMLRLVAFDKDADAEVTLDGEKTTWGDVQALINYVDNYNVLYKCANSGEELTDQHISMLQSLAEYLAGGQAQLTLESAGSGTNSGLRTEVLFKTESKTAYKGETDYSGLYPVGSGEPLSKTLLSGLDVNTVEYRVKAAFYNIFGHYFDVEGLYDDFVSKGLINPEENAFEPVWSNASSSYNDEIKNIFNVAYMSANSYIKTGKTNANEVRYAYEYGTGSKNFWMAGYFHLLLDQTLLGAPLPGYNYPGTNDFYGYITDKPGTLDDSGTYYTITAEEAAGNFLTYDKDGIVEGIAHTDVRGNSLPGKNIAWKNDLVLYTYNKSCLCIVDTKDDAAQSKYCTYDPDGTVSKSYSVTKANEWMDGLRYPATVSIGSEINIGQLMTALVKECDNKFISDWYKNVKTLADASELYYFIRSLASLNDGIAKSCVGSYHMFGFKNQYSNSDTDNETYTRALVTVLKGVYGDLTTFMAKRTYTFPQSKYGFKYNRELLLATNSSFDVELTEILDWMYGEGLIRVNVDEEGIANVEFLSASEFLCEDDQIQINGSVFRVGAGDGTEAALNARADSYTTNLVKSFSDEAVMIELGRYYKVAELIGKVLDEKYTDTSATPSTSTTVEEYVLKKYGMTREELTDENSQLFRAITSAIYSNTGLNRYAEYIQSTGNNSGDGEPEVLYYSESRNTIEFDYLDSEDWDSYVFFFCRVRGSYPESFQPLFNHVLSADTVDAERADIKGIVKACAADSYLTVNGHSYYSYEEVDCALAFSRSDVFSKKNTMLTYAGMQAYFNWILDPEAPSTNGLKNSVLKGNIAPEFQGTYYDYLITQTNKNNTSNDYYFGSNCDLTLARLAANLSPALKEMVKANAADMNAMMSGAADYITIDFDKINSEKISTDISYNSTSNFNYTLFWSNIRLVGTSQSYLPKDLSFVLTLNAGDFSKSKTITIPAGQAEPAKEDLQKLWEEYREHVRMQSSRVSGSHDDPVDYGATNTPVVFSFTVSSPSNSSFSFTNGRWGSVGGRAENEKLEQVRHSGTYSRNYKNSYETANEIRRHNTDAMNIEKIIIPDGYFYTGDIIPITIVFTSTVNIKNRNAAFVNADGTMECGITVDFNNTQKNVKPTAELNPGLVAGAVMYLTFPYRVDPVNTGSAGITAIHFSSTPMMKFYEGSTATDFSDAYFGDLSGIISAGVNSNCKIVTPDKINSFSEMTCVPTDETHSTYMYRLVFKENPFAYATREEAENNAYYAWAAADASPDQTLDKNNDGVPDEGFYLRSFYLTVSGDSTHYPFFVEYKKDGSETPIALYSYVNIPTVNKDEATKKYTVTLHSSQKFDETDDYILVNTDTDLPPLSRLNAQWKGMTSFFVPGMDKNTLFKAETNDVVIVPTTNWDTIISDAAAGNAFFINQFIETGDTVSFTYAFGNREGSFFNYSMTDPEQFEWVSSNPKVANVTTTLENYSFGTKTYKVIRATVAFTGVSGAVYFKLKVKNGDVEGYSYEIKTETLNVARGYLPYLAITGKTTYTVQGDNLNVPFVTNVIEKNNDNNIILTPFTITLYASDAKGVKTGDALYSAVINGSMSDVLSSVLIPGDRLTEVSVPGSFSYVAEISVINQSKEGKAGEVLVSSTKIVVKEAPVKPQMIPLSSYFMLDDKDVTLSFRLDNYKPLNAGAEAKYIVTKNGEVLAAYCGDVSSLTADADNVYTLTVPASDLTVPGNVLKDIYTVQILATNNALSSPYSTDSYLFYVYNHTSLDLLVTEACKGAKLEYGEDGKLTKIIFDNRDYLKPFIRTDEASGTQYISLGNGENQISIQQLREDLNLSAYFSLKYNDYVWGMLSDQIAWAVNGGEGCEYTKVGLTDVYSASRVYYRKSGDTFLEIEVTRDNYKAMRDDETAGGLYTVYADDITVNYKQGGYYSDINSYTYLSYLPGSKMLVQSVSSSGEKEISVTATHVNTGMQQTVSLSSKTLRDQLFLFQSNLETVVEFSFEIAITGGKKRVKVMSDEQGQLALYMPESIISDITLRATVDGVDYTGTIVRTSLRSCEQSVALLQIYPLNHANLRKLSEVTIYVKDDMGNPIAGKELVIRGGVYKNPVSSVANHGYCPNADLLVNSDMVDNKYGDSSSGRYDQLVTTDSLGRIIVRFNTTQFVVGEENNDLNGVSILYRFELTDPKNELLPALTSINVSPDKSSMAFGNGEITMRKMGGTSGKLCTFEKAFYAGEGDGGNTSTLDIDLLKRNIPQIGLSNKIKKANLTTRTVVMDDTAALVRQSSVRSEAEYEDNGNVKTGGDFMILNPNYDPDGNYGYYYNSKGEMVRQQSSGVECYYFSSVSFIASYWNMDDATFDNWLEDEEEDTLTYRLFVGGMEYYSEKQNYIVRNQYNIVDVADKDKGFKDQAGALASEIRDSLDMNAMFKNLVPGGDMLAKGLSFFSGIASGGDYVVNMLVAPTADPCIFNILISVGDDVEGKKEGEGFGIDYNATEEITKAIKEASGEEEEDGESPVKFNVFGAMRAQAVYDDDTKSWDLKLTGGKVGAKVSVEKEYTKNFMISIVPATISIGAKARISFAVSGNSSGDMLIGIGAGAEIRAFAGVGFDVGFAALKLGIEGMLGADAAFSTLTKFTGDVVVGSQLTISASIGLKFVAKLLFITYTKTFASASFEYTKQWGNYVSDILSGQTVQGYNYTAAVFDNGTVLYSIEGDAGMPSLDYIA